MGPHESSGRFAYWLARLAQESEILAPAPASNPMQFLDARDLGEWLVRMLAQKNFGTYNAVGPAKPLNFGQFLQNVQEVLKKDSEITWVNESFLLNHGIQPWTGLPLWTPTPS